MLDERILLDLGILVRLVVALAPAGVVGWERETSGKAAGLRTHMFVAWAPRCSWRWASC